ncbi:hypothetical protein ABZP36_015149 [Zizania latifolia]
MADYTVRYIEDYCMEVNIYLGNTLIDYYGRRGQLQSAEKVLFNMKDRNNVTMDAMITTYSKGWIHDYVRNNNIKADIIMENSLIDVYMKRGSTKEGLQLGTTNEACNTYGNVAIAEVVTKKLNELEPNNSGGDYNRWSDAMNVRQQMVNTDVMKSPGCSVVDPASSGNVGS